MPSAGEFSSFSSFWKILIATGSVNYMEKLCEPCTIVNEHPLGLAPRHVVNPHTGKRLVYDVYGLALCPTCGAVWHRDTRNNHSMIGVVPLTGRP
jgi:hypothetical protein